MSELNHIDSNLVNDVAYSNDGDDHLDQETGPQSFQSNLPSNYLNNTSPQKDAIKIHNYLIKEKIGSGTFAVVKLAEHIPTKAQVAIKMIDKRKMNKENMKNTWREIEIMKKIENHKNIVKLYQVLQTDDYLYLVTDYCEGGELFDYLDSNGKLEEDQARNLFKQLLDAIEYLHDKLSIAHRDLSKFIVPRPSLSI